MKRISIFFICGIVLTLFSCEKPDYPDNIFDPGKTGNPDPVITDISPADSAFSGIGILTITGENFSSTAGENLVYFNGKRGTVKSFSTTEITVQAPTLIADSVKIQVSVLGAYKFAERDHYKLYPPVVEWGGFDHFTSMYGVAMDTSENLYIATNEPSREVLRLNSAGVRDSLAYGTYTFLKADALRMGPGGVLYVARRYKKAYTIPAGGGAAETFMDVPNNTKTIDMDFDEFGNMYTGGLGNELYRVNVLNGETEMSIEATYPVDVYVDAIRVYDGYVYVIGEYIGSDTTFVVKWGVYRNQIITQDSLGPTELVFNWRDAVGPDQPIMNAITFAEDGSMIIGAESGAALYEVLPPYTGMTATPIYTEVIDPPASKLVWGNKNYLYVNSRSAVDTKKRIFRVDMVKNGAPYFGREL